MLSTIATFKENLSQIAMDVQDAAEELEISGSLAGDGASVSDRRASHRFAQSKSSLRSSSSNGIDESFKAEIEQYKAEIKRLQVSEAEIKAMSINYAAILKEKEVGQICSGASCEIVVCGLFNRFWEKLPPELPLLLPCAWEQLVRLHEENGYMKKNLEATNAGGFASRNESLKIPANSLNVHKGDGSQSNMRQHKHTSQASIRPTGNLAYRGILPKNDGSSNGSEQATQSGGNKQNMELKDNCLQGHEKGLANLLKENQSMAALKAACESEIKQLKEQLDKDRVDLANTKLQLQGEHEFNESSQKEIDILKMDKDRAFKEMKELHDELNNKISEIRRLQSELNRRDMEESVVTAESMKRVMEALEKENTNLKSEKDELVDALQQLRQCIPDVDHAVDSKASSKHLSNLNEVPSSGDFLGKEDTAQSQLKWEQSLNDACRERDKALQELARLKQHLLDKELEESDKMDEDRKLIEELQTNSEVQKAHILQLQKDLKQAISNQEEVKKINSTELQKAHETINDLKHKLASCMKTVDSKNVELLNLQTALGQYYAESEAKERLECDLAAAREELANHSELLKNANQRLEASKQEKDDLLAKLSKAERTLSDGQYTIQKLEEDNLKLRRALDQSMTRLNRMSMDSDYFVDRRIVIKLLVTYFQRNHSKEVLDLMVRMLGFSDEDKQRIGFAQQVAGKGVVRGVLGLPGRLVGGILGGSSSSAHTPSENQSFADLWVDFLLKETEERERRETAKAAVASTQTQEAAPGNLRTPSSATVSTSFQTINPSIDSEFSNVPLTSTVSPSPEKSARLSRLLLRY